MDNSNLKQKTDFITFEKSDNNERFYAQSMSTAGTVETNTGSMVDNETVTDFHSEMASDIVTMLPKSVDVTYESSDYMMSNLSTWLERPRLILAVPWTVDAVGFNPQIFFPYLSFLRGLNSAALIRKLDNHYLLRGTLVLKFLINGSPFHYGRARAVYRPGAFDNSVPANLNPRHPIFPTNYSGLGIYPNMLTTYSQRVGVFIDPGSNLPVEMKIPFFCLKNYIDLRNIDVDLEMLGNVTLYPQNLLRHANGAIDPVSISVFAYMENPVLSTPTASSAFQGESKSEYGNGIISKPASAVARFAGRLRDVPYIGKFAMATEIGASGVASIASLWGYSKPLQLEPSVFMRPRPIGGLALTSGEDAIAKLSLDPKQEVSVDPTTVGLENKDQMALAYVLQRESLILQFPWVGTRNEGDILCGWKIHPMVYPRGISTLPPLVTHHMSSLAWASMPFLHWRGSLHYRIQVIASANHRGRLLIQYDPNHLLASTAPNMQTRFSQVLDLTQARDMTFCVNYNRADMYLPTLWDTSVADASTSLTGAFTADNRQYSNGILIVSVLNELAAPISTTTVDINVYIKAGDDFELHNPAGRNMDRLSYKEATTYAGQVITALSAPGGGDLESFQAESKFTPIPDCENEPEQCKYHVINGTAESSICEDLKKVQFGEQIVSIRSLLKRYNLVDVTKAVANPSGLIKNIRINRPDIPAGPGLPYGTSTPTTPDNINSNRFSYIRYFMGGFAAYKGGVRYKYLCHANTPPNNMWAHRRPQFNGTATRATTTPGSFLVSAATTASAFAADFSANNTDLGAKDGCELVSFPINGIIEFELPWQSDQRFAYCHNIVYPNEALDTVSYSSYQFHNHSVVTTFGTTQNLTEPGFFTYFATAEDFSLFHFINAPILYSRSISTP